MVASPPAAPSRIFISYRREETAYPAGWLYDRLADHYGAGQVFKDVGAIELGDDFVEVISTAVGSCDVLLALIGEEWLTITDQHGRRRLDNPDDFVRLEIEAALERNVLVIPILVDGARMPHADELPDSLARLVRRQALELSPSRFDFDLGRLLRVLDKTLTEVHVEPTAPPEPAEREAAERRSRDPGREAAEWRAREREAKREAVQRPWEPEREAAEWKARERKREAAERRVPARPRRRWRSWLRSWSEAQRSPVGRSTPPERPGPDDEVTFTAGYPGVLTPQLWYSLSVYIHLSRLQAEADRRIADESRWFGQRPAGSKAAAQAPLPKGTQLRVSPEVRGVAFNPPTQELRWLEDLQQVAFRLQATSEAAGQTVLGAVEVHAGPLLVAQVPLSIHIRGVGEPEWGPGTATASTGRLFSSVFTSYAHEDDHVVRAFAEAYRALGIDVLVDKTALRAGEDWKQTLLRLIEEADLFQLFWSEAASRSPYVAEEWQHALLLQDRKGGRFIRPLYWTSPWPPPPAQLAHLHFAALDLTALSSVAGRSRSRPRLLRRR